MSTRFGDYLRAARLGFGLVSHDGIEVWVRITGPYREEKPWLVEFALTAKDMRPSAEDFRCWWENDKDGERLFEVCKAVRHWDGKPGAFWVDEDGAVLKEQPL